MNSDRRRSVSQWILIAIALVLLGASSGVAQQADQPTAGDSEADLLKELETDLLKDLPAAKRPTADKSNAPKGATRPSAEDRQLLDKLKAGEDLGDAPENPLLTISQQMRAVQERIAEEDTSDETQTAQSEIVAKLAKLIEQAQKQGGQQNKSARGRGTGKAGVGDGEATPGAPQDSTDRVGKPQTEAPQPTDVRSLLERIWGHLPDKTRSEMQNALSDQFLPKYERLIEEYYKRLAEERSGADDGVPNDP